MSIKLVNREQRGHSYYVHVYLDYIGPSYPFLYELERNKRDDYDCLGVLKVTVIDNEATIEVIK